MSQDMEISQEHHYSPTNYHEEDPNSIHTPILPTRTVSRFKAQLTSFHWHGVKPIPLLFSLTTGLITRFAIPKPSKVTTQAWTLLSIFITTISGLVVAPLPVGAWSFVCLTLTLVTKTLTFQEGFNAMTNEVIWLIVVAFFFSRGFVKSGLGDRVAMYFIKWLGRKTVGLAYGLVLGEALVSPAIPSSTARAGGVFSPVIKSVALNNGSLPFDKKSARKIGSYLVMSQMQVIHSFKSFVLTIMLGFWLSKEYFMSL